MLVRTGRASSRFATTPAVFTIHNLAYQGIFDASWLPRLGFGWDLMRVDALEYWNRISYLKAGVVFSRLRSEEHTSELQSLRHLVCRLLLEKKKKKKKS